MRFPGQQGQIFGPQHPNHHANNHGMPNIHPQAQPTPPVMHARAKWHIPQSVQQNNGTQQTWLYTFNSLDIWHIPEMAGPSNQNLMMTYKVSKDGDSYKISLRSPNSLRPASQNGAQVGPAANVTSTNPKTPSPSTNDVSCMLQERKKKNNIYG